MALKEKLKKAATLQTALLFSSTLQRGFLRWSSGKRGEHM